MASSDHDGSPPTADSQPATAEPSRWSADPFSLKPKESRWLIALVFAGIALRILIVVFRAGELNSDPDAYVAHAETWRQTGGYNVPGTNTPTAFRPPFYPALLATLRLTGMKLRVAIGLINVVAGALVIIATWWMARLIGLRGLWPTVAAAVVGLDPLLLRYTVLPMTEVLSAALVSFAVLQVLKARLFVVLPICDNGRLNSPTKSAIVAGVCFGLGGLCRPVILVTCALLTLVQAAMLCWQAFGRNRSAEERRLSVLMGRVVVIPALVAGLIILPWIIRNAIHLNAFVPATSHGGYTLLLGNNDEFYNEVVLTAGHPAWTGKSLNRWQQQLQTQLDAGRAATDQPLDGEVAVDRWMYDQAIGTIKNRPGDFVRACVLRWQRFWALSPSVDAESEESSRLVFPVSVWYGGMWVGLVGSILLCVRHCVVLKRLRGRQAIDDDSSRASNRDVTGLQLLWLAVFSLLLLHTFYWTNTRMRAPVMGLLCVLAASGWQYWYCAFQQRGGRSG